MTEQEQIEEMANDIAKHCPDLVGTCCGETSCVTCLTKALYAAGYRKPVKGYWRVVSYTDGTFYTHSILTCSVCGNKQATVTSMFPNHCDECGSRMTESVLEKVLRYEEEWKGGSEQ